MNCRTVSSTSIRDALAQGDLTQRIDVPDEWSDLLVAGSPVNADELVVVGRRGGPEFLDSEVARLAHLIAMAASLRRNA